MILSPPFLHHLFLLKKKIMHTFKQFQEEGEGFSATLCLVMSLSYNQNPLESCPLPLISSPGKHIKDRTHSPYTRLVIVAFANHFLSIIFTEYTSLPDTTIRGDTDCLYSRL